MTNKDYERAAKIVQQYYGPQALLGHKAHPTAAHLQEAFVEFFQGDNPRFDAVRFRNACVPGVNVKARSKRAAND